MSRLLAVVSVVVALTGMTGVADRAHIQTAAMALPNWLPKMGDYLKEVFSGFLDHEAHEGLKEYAKKRQTEGAAGESAYKAESIEANRP